MDNSALVSVIVPVYKVEDYLDRCVESVLRQSYTSFELLLVDDGSPDRCGALCDAWAEKDWRIRVFHKPNGGLSSARNLGTEKARGAYLCYLDSDDYLAPDALEYLLGLLQREEADIACGALRMVQDGGESFADQPEEQLCVFTGEEACLALNTEEDYMSLVTATAKLYRREIACAVRFPEGRLHEDEATAYRFCYLSRRVVRGTREIYGYYQGNAGSITHNRSERSQRDYLAAALEQISFFRGKGSPALARAAADRFLNNASYLAAEGDGVMRAFLRSGEARDCLREGVRFKTRLRCWGSRLFGVDLTRLYNKILGR